MLFILEFAFLSAKLHRRPELCFESLIPYPSIKKGVCCDSRVNVTRETKSFVIENKLKTVLVCYPNKFCLDLIKANPISVYLYGFYLSLDEHR